MRQLLGLGIAAIGALCSGAAQAQTYGPHVYGGKEAPVTEAPWHAVVYLSNQGAYSGLLCGATVIAPNWLLTAAHCFFNEHTGARYPDYFVSVAAGSNRLTGPSRRLPVEQVHVHEGYKFNAWDNDVALVELKRASMLPPIALAVAADEKTAKPLYRVTGWGKTETQKVSDTLLYADVPAVPSATCAKVANYASQLTDRHFCAGIAGTDTCKGDSGGPLYQRIGVGAAVQFGVTVAGEGCGANPGVYARVTQYRSWIEKKVGLTGQKLTDSAQLRQTLTICTAEKQSAGWC